ncbi:MAG: peptidoglycan DD-metalloendopeptidase family protein [Clostridia bacterium]|nr:peptidoglycan DD-metalloendopeptidase family protein [Clostridia bacterium]
MMKNKTLMKQALSSVICVFLAVMLVFSCSFGVIAEDSVSSLQEKIAAAKEKAAELETKEEAANETYQAKLEVYNTAKDAVDTINAQIADLEEKIVETQDSIEKLKKKIKKQQQAIDKKYNDFKSRIKALYIAGSLTSMQVLLTSEDFSDYLTKLEMVRKVSAKDNAAIEEMQRLAEELKEAKKNLDEDKQKLEQQEASLQEDKVSLDAAKEAAEQAYNESLVVLRKIKSQQKNNNSQLAEYQSELNDVLEQIRKAEEAARQAQGGSQSSGSQSFTITQGTGQFCYPVPGHTSITCGFYGYANHNGVDFSDGGIYGATVVAADSGTVVKVAYLTYSYGYHVFIYHGGSGLTTQYCHLSSIGVSEGQSVSKGDPIGNVGSTGNSTGPHLHFGIFDSGGSFLNPEGYF